MSNNNNNNTNSGSSTNQQNETNFNLVNTTTNNNNNNVNINEINQTDSNLKPQPQSAPSIYWNDQNEEAFLQEIELQNLFANTLLHDDFNNDETDFNCLGIDNLQLNYTNDSSNDQLQQQQQQQQPISTSTATPPNSLNDNNNNLLSSLSLISLNNSNTHHDENDFILHSGNTFNTFNTIDVSNLINQSAEATILDLNPIQLQLDSIVTQTTSTTINSTDSAFKSDNQQHQITQTSQTNDDTVFKKPNLFESFFTTTSINSNLSNSTNQSNSSRNSSSSSTTSTTRRTTNLPSDLTKLTKSKLKQQQKQTITLLEPIDLIAQLKKMNNFKDDSTKLQSLQHKQKEDEFKSDFNLTSTNNNHSNNKNENFTSIQTVALTSTSSSTINKLFSLKRSRKRSKLISNSNKSTSGSTQIDTNSSNSSSLNQTKLNLKLAKTASNKTNKKEKKEKLKQIKLNTINLEPLNKKLAIDKSSADIVTQTSLVKLKKDEVELHIKELSLLDLHSSEDDSNELLIKNSLSNNLKKNVRSSSNDNNNNSNVTNINSVKNSNYLNEIISKRIKYSPALNSSTSLNKSDETQLITINTTSNQDLNNSTNNKERKIDKLIQYLTKSSLDSNGHSVSSSTSSNESLQLVKKLTNQEINDNQSPPPTNSQNKRKKNETDLISLPITINEVISSSVSDESSKSIDNDTLQHMKNLDLNLDLIPTENKTTFKKNKHSIISEEDKFVEDDIINSSSQTSAIRSTSSTSLTVDLKDVNSRKILWNLLKTNSSLDEMIEEFGAELHDKLSFWDLVKLKLKFSKNSQLKTTYDIIDDYTVLYSNMSDLLESFVEEHSSTKSITLKKNENSSRSRSSSRNCRKQSTTAPMHRI